MAVSVPSPVKPQEASRPLIDRLLPWFRPSLTARNLKTFIRCLLVMLASLVLMLDHRSLVAMGQAGFFAALLNPMLPPSMPLSLFFFASVTLLLGMLLGWAWGCVGMAAGIAARNRTLLASQYQNVQATMANNPEATTSSFVFEGAFLDTRASATFGALFFIGCFAMGAVRAHAPKLTLLSIFGTIVMDLMFSYGPLFPSHQYMLATTFLIPTSSYVAIALVALIVVFPQSMSHLWLSGFSRGFLSPSLALLANQHDLLNLPHPLSAAAWAPLVARGKTTRSALAEAVQELQTGTAMVDLEVSVGRLGPGDIKALDGLLKVLVYRTLAMGNFSSFVLAPLQAESEDTDPSGSSSTNTSKPLNDHAHSGARFAAVQHALRRAEDAHGHGLGALLPVLARASEPLRQACTGALEGAQAYFDDVNGSRWEAVPLLGRKRRTDVPDLTAVRAGLEERLRAFRDVDRRQLVDGPFGAYFRKLQEQQERGDPQPEGTEGSRSLFLCFVFTTTLESYVESLLDLLALAAALQRKRTRTRLWAPSGFGKLWRRLTKDGSADVIGGGGQVQERAEQVRREEEEAEAEREREMEEAEAEREKGAAQPVGAHRSLARNPDAAPPRTALQKLGVRLNAVFRWLKSAKGLFALRYAFVSLCLWVVAVHPRSARFNYANRGVWALIMAQTGLGVYAGEQIAQFLLRLLGTLIGLVFGMVAWYVGAGHGNGNPYGVAASTLFFTAPFLYARIVLPLQKMVVPMMAGVTLVFVVGYSWLDTHLVLTVNSGVGVHLAWKRALLVIIGFAAGFVIMCFPKLTTARTLVRESCAAITAELSGIFISEVEALLQEEAVARSSALPPHTSSGAGPQAGAQDRKRKERNLQRIGRRVLALVGQMQSLQPSLTTARFEPQLQGPWPKEHYIDLLDTQWRIVSSSALLSSALAKLEPAWCATLVHRSPFLNPDLITDCVATLALTSQALLAKRPLPPSVHSLRDRLVYHDHSGRLRRLFAVHGAGHKGGAEKTPSSPAGSAEGKEGAVEDDDDDEAATLRSASAAGSVDGASLGIAFTSSISTDPQFAHYATAVIALSSLYTAFDRLTDITRGLVGEGAQLTLLREWEGRGLALEEEGRRGTVGGGSRPERRKEE